MKHEPGTPKPELFCRVYELQEVREGKRRLVEKKNLKLLENRGGDPRKNCLQVSVNAFESEPAKVRKRDMYHNRSMQQLPLDFTVGNRGVKVDYESPVAAGVKAIGGSYMD
jgi:hypothetical protein